MKCTIFAFGACSTLVLSGCYFGNRTIDIPDEKSLEEVAKRYDNQAASSRSGTHAASMPTPHNCSVIRLLYGRAQRRRHSHPPSGQYRRYQPRMWATVSSLES